MAFNNTKRLDLGGGLSLVYGDFTQTAGGGSQTLAIGAGEIYGVLINPQRTADPVDVQNLYSTSISGSINTLTIYGNVGVTAGTFCVIIGLGA